MQGMGWHQEVVMAATEVSLSGQKMREMEQMGYISKLGTTQHSAHVNEFWKGFLLIPKLYKFWGKISNFIFMSLLFLSHALYLKGRFSYSAENRHSCIHMFLLTSLILSTTNIIIWTKLTNDIVCNPVINDMTWTGLTVKEIQTKIFKTENFTTWN